MLDHLHLPTARGNAEVFEFLIPHDTARNWYSWQKPRGKSMVDILLVGFGGNGGNGAVGANNAAAGGGGGASGGQTRVIMPLALLPDELFIGMATSLGSASVSIYPDNTANHRIAFANGGGNGGNASGAAAGTGGSIASAAAAANMPLGWAFASALSGQAGAAGLVTTGSTTNITLPATGLFVTGGCGATGVQDTATSGLAGGGISAVGAFPAHVGGSGSNLATLPPGAGSDGYRPIPGLLYGYGGTGGGSSHGSATSTGLFGGNGGNGAPGCGGGGGGGCLTGGTAGTGGRGGLAFCLITCW